MYLNKINRRQRNQKNARNREITHQRGVCENLVVRFARGSEFRCTAATANK